MSAAKKTKSTSAPGPKPPRSYAAVRRAEARRIAAARATEEAAQAIEAKVVAIGNSRGIRLPRAVLTRYEIGEAVLLEVREGGLFLRGKDDARLSWEDTYKEMARAREDFSDLDAAAGDGLDKEPW
jgi:antitoxin MazE